MSYYRVIPRDLFNEAKLLKCLGMLSLKILDRVSVAKHLKEETWGLDSGFQINQNPLDGAIFVANHDLFCGESNIYLCSPLNSKKVNPLEWHFGDCADSVFDDAGDFSEEFCALVKNLTKGEK